MTHQQSSASLLKTKEHILILDGLRGVAAIAVVIFHFMEFVIPDYTKSFIAHAYLAVDFFFCLSGFVIAYAYDHKIRTIGLKSFFKMRLIRLHPLVVIGAFIGLILFVFDPFSSLYTQYGAGLSLLMFVSAAFLIPFPLVHERYFNLFHLNPPTWSLFWEYLANIVYALILIRLPRKWLWTLLVLAATALCYEAHRSTYLGVGWGGDNVTGGGIRVAYSFLAGVLMFRMQWIIRSRIGFSVVAVLLLGAFMFPFSPEYNQFIDPMLVILYFPLLVALGAGATLRPSLTRICRFSGNISYPLYVIHYPFLWLFLSYLEKYHPTMPVMISIIPVGTLVLITMAHLVLKYVDEPVRKYLRKRWIAA